MMPVRLLLVLVAIASASLRRYWRAMSRIVSKARTPS